MSDSCLSDIKTESDTDFELFKDLEIDKNISIQDNVLNLNSNRELSDTPQCFHDNNRAEEGRLCSNDETLDTAYETVLVPHQVPCQPTAKPVRFGEKVEEIRRQILFRRQMCFNRDEYGALYNQIDDWINKASIHGQHSIAIRLQFDKAIVAHFGLEFEKALTISAEARKATNKVNMSPDEAFQMTLIGKFLESSIHSRQGRNGQAWGILTSIASDIQGSTNYFDHWRLHYNMGTNLLALLKVSPDSDGKICENAVTQFHKCRDSISSGESSGQAYDEQDHFFPLVMIAKLLLELPEHQLKRQKSVVKKSRIEKAQSYIHLICTDYFVPNMVIRFKLRFLITLAGLFFRRGQYHKRQESKETETRTDFTDAMLVLECASYMTIGSPYEESEIIEQFLRDLQNSTEGLFLHQDLYAGSGMYRNESILTDSDPLDMRTDEFVSDDFGNPTSSKTKKRKGTLHRNKNTINRSSGELTTSTSISSGLDSRDSFASHEMFSFEQEVWFKLLQEEHSMNEAETNMLDKIICYEKAHMPDENYPPSKIPYQHLADSSDSPTVSDSESLASLDTELYTPEVTNPGHLRPKQHNILQFHFLTRHEIHECQFQRRLEHFPTVDQRNQTLAEINRVLEIFCRHSCRKPQREEPIAILLVSGMLALDYPNTELGQSRFVASISNLKIALRDIEGIKQRLPIYASVCLKIDLLVLIASFYVRAAQHSGRFKQKASCKFCLNLAMFYVEFAYVMAKHHLVDGKMDRIVSLQNYAKRLAKEFLETGLYSSLFPESG